MTHCSHVYQNRGVDICDLCGKDTHRYDWTKQNALNEQWKLENPNPEFGGWWSI